MDNPTNPDSAANVTPVPVNRPVRIGMVAGEASGDLLGEGLIKSLRRHFSNCVFEGVGGDRMLAQGFLSFFPQDRLAVMGLVEPLKRLPELLGIRRTLRQHFIQNPPDLFIGIDSPDFNLDLELQLRKNGIKTAHYVSPSVWAWRQGRVKKIARAVDLMLTLLPFEADFYKSYQVPVTFVGHPLADSIPLTIDKADAQRHLGLSDDTTYVALLPGSRANEVEQLGRLFLETAHWCSNRCLEREQKLEFVIPSANSRRHQQLEQLLSQFPGLPVHLIAGQSQQVMAASDVVLMASGTTSLEAMLLKRPMVIAYRMAPLSFAILSKLVKVKSVGLPNLLSPEPLVPEILQDAATAPNLGAAIMNYLESPEKVAQLQAQFLAIHHQLRCDADKTAAAALAALIQQDSAPC